MPGDKSACDETRDTCRGAARAAVVSTSDRVACHSHLRGLYARDSTSAGVIVQPRTNFVVLQPRTASDDPICRSLPSKAPRTPHDGPPPPRGPERGSRRVEFASRRSRRDTRMTCDAATPRDRVTRRVVSGDPIGSIPDLLPAQSLGAVVRAHRRTPAESSTVSDSTHPVRRASISQRALQRGAERGSHAEWLPLPRP